jgi:hypothetical protein
MVGMASGTDGPSGLDATSSSLELALDQAIARRFAGSSERGGKKRRNTPVQNFAVGAHAEAHTPTENLRGQSSTALAVPSRETSLMRPPPRLCWRGIEVSDEFQQYAARVARGEDLEPYRGPVLSRPSAEFPWSVAPERQLLPPERLSLAPVRPSFAPVSMAIGASPVSERTVYPERGRALKTTLWLVGAVSSIVAALGVGAGATNTDGSEFDDLASGAGKLAREPAPAAAAAPTEGLASSLDDAADLERSIGERQLASLAAANAKADADAKLDASSKATPTPARALAPSVLASPLAARPLPAASRLPATASAPPSSARPLTSPPASSASRLAIPPAGPAPSSGDYTHGGVVTTARPAGGRDALTAGNGGSLFSDRPSF